MNNPNAWLQFALYVGALLVITKPLGLYLVRVLDPHGRTMIQIERAVDDLAATAARLRNLAERVDRDPSVLLRGRR